MNEKNLVSLATRPQQERTEIARMGQKASTEARKRKKSLKEAMELLLSLPVKDTRVKKKIESLGINPNEIDNQMAMAIAQWQQAVKGNTKAYQNIEATIGEKPKESISVEDTREKTKKLDNILEQLK